MANKKLDWREIPQRFRYLSKNLSGSWYFHTEVPVMNAHDCVWHSDDMYHAYWLHGRRPKIKWENSITTRDADAKYTKPTVNWKLVDSHFNWIATNEDGEVFAFSDRPSSNDSVKGDGYWNVNEHEKSLWIDDAACGFRLGTCGWKSSLLERPDRVSRLKPSLNWAIVPDKYQWLATDQDNQSWLYQNKPEIDSDRRWIDPIGAGCCPVTRRDDFFLGKLSWYDSLVERPL